MAKKFLNNISINDAYTLPATDGTNGQVIATNGSGTLSFVDQTGGSGGGVSEELAIVYAIALG